GKILLDARNLANGRLPDDPTMPARAFPGFVLFPQVTSGAWGSGDNLTHVIRMIRLLCKRHNIDQDRIYIHGLSQGGKATHEILEKSPWLFAAGLTMSPVFWNPDGSKYARIQNIPLWLFQGGKDNNPYPSQSETFMRNFREAGGNVRYTLFPNLGHGTWNDAWAQPDFFTWLLSKRKSNIHVDFGNPNICATNGVGPTLRLAPGFYAY